MKRRTTRRNFGNGYRKTTVAGKSFFFKHGKRIKESSFKKAVSRFKEKQSDYRWKKIESGGKVNNWIKISPQTGKKTRRIVRHKRVTGEKPFLLCRKSDRQELYDQILKDRHDLQLSLPGEDFDDLRIVAEIGEVKKSRKHVKDLTQQGTRYFSRIRKFKNFLGLEYRYPRDKVPNWTRRGICKYEKRIYVVKVKTRGERIIGHKILKRYALENQ